MAQFTCGVEVWERLCKRAENVVGIGANIGANIGYYTIAGAATASGGYVAYEPHPRSCVALRANVALNRRRVEVVEAVVVPDEESANVELIVPTGTDWATPAGAMVRGSTFDADTEQRKSQSITVDARPIASAIAGFDLIKLDVEGFETALLHAAREQILSTRPTIMIEIHDHNTELRALLSRLLADLNADVYAMRRDHLTRVDAPLIESGSFTHAVGTWDFLIVPDRKRAMVDRLVRRGNTPDHAEPASVVLPRVSTGERIVMECWRSLRHAYSGVSYRMARRRGTPIPLTTIMNRQGSDKGTVHGYRAGMFAGHAFTEIYEKLFADRRYEPIRCLKSGPGPPSRAYCGHRR